MNEFPVTSDQGESEEGKRESESESESGREIFFLISRRQDGTRQVGETED